MRLIVLIIHFLLFLNALTLRLLLFARLHQRLIRTASIGNQLGELESLPVRVSLTQAPQNNFSSSVKLSRHYCAPILSIEVES